jgi:hypothetical protein
MPNMIKTCLKSFGHEAKVPSKLTRLELIKSMKADPQHLMNLLP